MANINIKTRLGEMYDEDRSVMTPTRRKMIHEHRKKMELYGPELPYQFGVFKPKLGKKVREVVVECECGRIMFVSKITHVVICSHCGAVVGIR